MSEPARLPTQEELDRLAEAVRRDPGSPQFIALGEAYLALGRARDAVTVGAQGLRASPDSVAGRMMVGRALVALHEWKHAQAELLKVVKADKSHGAGFRLLGEVLMRRADYERAVPVLQHAQNLDPANPEVLALLKRARAGMPLDDPPPIPTPRSPAGARPSPPRPNRPSAPPPFRASGPAPLDDEPTNVAEDLRAATQRDDPTEQTMSAPELEESTALLGRPGAAPAPPLEKRLPLRAEKTGARNPVADRATAPARRPPPASEPPPPPPRGRQARPSDPPPGGGERVRPRILPAERRPDAAREPLRRSAAMGEDFINQLMAGGLLDVPSVRVPDADFDLRPEKRWGRSTKRIFALLFTLLIVGTAGGVTWYVYTERQKEEAVTRHLATAEARLTTGSYFDLEAAQAEAEAASERDKDSTWVPAVRAEIGALRGLLYGTDIAEVEPLVFRLPRWIDSEDDRGYRELVIARAALTLARLSAMEEPETELAELRAELDAYLAGHDDAWLRWLQGRAMLAAGDRSGALKAFEQAAAVDGGPVVALIERADLLLDNGEIDQALTLYGRALDKAPGHPLAVIGRSLARAEAGIELTKASEELSVTFAKKQGPRTDAYRDLVWAYLHYANQHLADFEKSLATAVGVPDPRFQARVGRAKLWQGKFDEAAAARLRIRWYNQKGTEREDDPLVLALEAELHLVNGRPKAALARSAKLTGWRAHRVRGLAAFDQGQWEEAITQLQAALEIASGDRELKTWLTAATALRAKGKERDASIKQLAELSLNSNSRAPTYVHGLVLLAAGRIDDADYELRKSVKDLTVESPNPLAYRAHLALAEVAYRRGKLDEAGKALGEALALNAVYLPAQMLLGKLAVAQGNHAEAADALGQVVSSTEDWMVDAALLVSYAEALGVTAAAAAASAKEEGQKKEAAAMKQAAIDALKKAIELKIDPAAASRVAALIDPALPEQLQLPPPPDADGKGGKKRGR